MKGWIPSRAALQCTSGSAAITTLAQHAKGAAVGGAITGHGGSAPRASRSYRAAAEEALLSLSGVAARGREWRGQGGG